MNASVEGDIADLAPPSANGLPFAPTSAGLNAWLNGLNQWMKPLSSVHSNEACRALFGIVQSLSTMELPALQRLQLLEALRPRVLHCASGMERCFVETPPLPEAKVLKARRTALRFHTELAANYGRLVGDAGFQDVLSIQQKATAIHRALISHGLYLLRTAQMHEAPADGYWAHAYSLFRCAEEMKGADAPIVDTDAPLAGPATVRQALARIAVFHVADPLALDPRQMASLFRLIGEHAEHVALTTHPLPQTDNLYALDLGSDAPPLRAQAPVPGADGKRYMHLRPEFLRVFRGEVALAAVGSVATRRFAPLPTWDSCHASRTVVYSVGIEGVAARMRSHQEALERILSGRPPKAPQELGLVPKDAEQPEANPELASSNGTQRVKREEIWASRTPETVAAPHSAFGLLNRDHASGHPILIGERRRLAAGSVVCYAGGEGTMGWAIVRNATPALDAECVWAELEVLDALVEPVQVRIEGEQRQCLQALLCTSADHSGTLRLLLPPIALANGTWLVLVREDGHWINQRILRLHEMTGCMHSYQLVPPEASLRLGNG